MRGIHRHYNGEIDGESIEPPINSGDFGAFGRGGIVKPSSPTLRLRWEWMVSVTREGSKIHMLTVRGGHRVGLCQMAGEGRLSEVQVKRRNLSWI